MRIEVLLFASLRDIAGDPVISVELPPGSTVAQLLGALEELFPDFRGRLGQVRVAIDHEFAAPDVTIPAGSEVALIPPVSGGGGDEEPLLALVHEVIDTESWVRRVASPDCGATVTFRGVVRNEHHGREVLRLEYSAYPDMVLAQMSKIAAAIHERWEVRKVAIIHRVGTLEIGETSILIALSLPHRGDGFDALRYAIDTFKEAVPIWKKEYFADGEAFWVEGS